MPTAPCEAIPTLTMAGGGPPLSVARWRFGSGTAVLFFGGRTRFLCCDTAVLAVLAMVVVLVEIVVLAVRAALVTVLSV